MFPFFLSFPSSGYLCGVQKKTLNTYKKSSENMSARMSQDVWNFSQGRGLWFLLHKALKVSYRKCSTAKDESVHVALTRACRGDLVIQGASEDCSIVLQSSKTLASFWENRIHAWQTNVVAEHAQLYQRLARGTKAISWIYGVLQARSYIWNVFGPYWFWRGGLIQLHAETRSLALNFLAPSCPTGQWSFDRHQGCHGNFFLCGAT